MSVFYLRLRSLIRKSGLTQTEFAKKIDAKPQNINNWLRNKSCPSWEALQKIGSFFNVCPSYMMIRDFHCNAFDAVEGIKKLPVHVLSGTDSFSGKLMITAENEAVTVTEKDIISRSYLVLKAPADYSCCITKGDLILLEKEDIGVFFTEPVCSDSDFTGLIVRKNKTCIFGQIRAENKTLSVNDNSSERISVSADDTLEFYKAVRVNHKI